eukprot:1434222-Amphidinium_carterae.3
MAQLGVSICCVQETRLTLDPTFSKTTHSFTTSPAEHGKGGLATIIEKAPHVKLIEQFHLHRRIHATTLTFHSVHLHVVNSRQWQYRAGKEWGQPF